MGKWFGQAEEIERLRHQVERQEREINFLKAQLAGMGVQPIGYTFGIDDTERELVASGRTIQAIKHYRERTGAGLIEAKEVIDRIR